MKLIFGVITLLAVITSPSSFARRRDCEQAIIGEETFAIRRLQGPRTYALTEGPTRVFGETSYRSIEIDGQPGLFFRRHANGLTVRWSGRASVSKLRGFAERMLSHRKVRG